MEDKTSQTIRTAFSPGEDCRNLIIELINNAISNLDICVFTISDDLITSALIKAFENGINIRIITDNDKKNDLGSDIKELYYKGIDVHIDESSFHMHHKFMIVDQQLLLTGSYNWTRSAAKFNEENLIVVSDTQTANDFQLVFDSLWDKTVSF